MIALVDILDEHSEAIEYDLIRSGSRLRDFPDDGVSWRDMWILVRQAQPDSAVFRVMQGDEWQRTLEVELLRLVELRLRTLNWQWSGGSGAPPEPIELPWDEPAIPRPDSMDWDDAMAWLGWSDRPELHLVS